MGSQPPEASTARLLWRFDCTLLQRQLELYFPMAIRVHVLTGTFRGAIVMGSSPGLCRDRISKQELAALIVR
jgi:hypothetical protein